MKKFKQNYNIYRKLKRKTISINTGKININIVELIFFDLTYIFRWYETDDCENGCFLLITYYSPEIN